MKKQPGRINNGTIYTLLLVGCIVGFWLFENFYTPDTYSAPKGEHKESLLPDFFIPSLSSGEIIRHNHYWLSYIEAFEQAEWVGYTLERSHLTNDERERPYFIEDPKVKSKSADWKNFKGSGYDRGHLCPAGDRRFSEYAYNETFYTSNISPQNREFNAGVWNRLEMQVRSWCKRYGTLYVATGGVLQKGLSSIGEEDVAIPNMYYKIIAKGTEDDLQILAFLIPHRKSKASLDKFLVPVSTVEKLTGINFFEHLNDSYEKQLEESVLKENWRF